MRVNYKTFMKVTKEELKIEKHHIHGLEDNILKMLILPCWSMGGMMVQASSKKGFICGWGRLLQTVMSWF